MSRGLNCVHKKKGFVLVSVLAVVGTLVILAGAFSSFVFYRIHLTSNIIHATKAYSLARSAVSYARAQITYDPVTGTHDIPTTTPITITTDNGGPISLVFSGPINDIVTVDISATFGNITKNAVCSFEALSYLEEVYLINWS